MREAFRLYTDGGARGNPGPAGIGVLLEDPLGAVVAERARGIGWTTNNAAEYLGLIEGLRTALANRATILEVLMDSKLVVEQMNGNFKVRNPGLKPLHAEAQRLAREFDRISFRSIPREQNQRADRLSNDGMDEQERSNPQGRPAGKRAEHSGRV